MKLPCIIPYITPHFKESRPLQNPIVWALNPKRLRDYSSPEVSVDLPEVEVKPKPPKQVVESPGAKTAQDLRGFSLKGLGFRV